MTMSLVKRRQAFMAIHRYLGLTALAFLTIAGLTGCLLCFEKPLDRALNPALYRPTTPGLIAPPLAVAAFERSHAGIVATSFPVRPTVGRNILVQVTARPGSAPLDYDQIFLDAGDGHLVGSREDRAAWDRPHATRLIYWLHCTLIAGTPGRWVMGCTALLWLIGNFVGLYITLPLRRPYLRYWRKCWTFRRSPSWRQTFLDLHRVCGLWLIVPLTALALTSLAMSFYSEAFMPMIEALSPPRPSPFDQSAPSHPPSTFPPLTELLDRAEGRSPPGHAGWLPSAIEREPDRGLAAVQFTRSGYTDYSGLGPVTDWFDAQGRLVYEDDPYRDSLGMAVSRSLFPIHTGQMIGWAGIALDFALGIATAFMGGSGLYLWSKRTLLRQARHKRTPVAVSR
jgi:uncharacterized iron-regulated membrane protein